jgi:hypothetical protein
MKWRLVNEWRHFLNSNFVSNVTSDIREIIFIYAINKKTGVHSANEPICKMAKKGGHTYDWHDKPVLRFRDMYIMYEFWIPHHIHPFVNMDYISRKFSLQMLYTHDGKKWAAAVNKHHFLN